MHALRERTVRSPDSPRDATRNRGGGHRRNGTTHLPNLTRLLELLDERLNEGPLPARLRRDTDDEDVVLDGLPRDFQRWSVPSTLACTPSVANLHDPGSRADRYPSSRKIAPFDLWGD